MLEPSAANANPSDRARSVAAPPLRPESAGFGALLGSVQRHLPQFVNIALLVVGLGLGQGSIFIVQTVLVAAGAYELLAAFGTHYSFAILGIILVDAGSGTTLARVVARLSTDGKPSDEIWRIFCETTAIRLLIAALIGTAAVTYAGGFASDDFSRWYVPMALPGLLLWAVNGVGLLDGLRLSGISGITGSAAYVVTAIGLALSTQKPTGAAGAFLGGAFSIGYVLTVAAQWAILGRKGWLPRLEKITRKGMAKSFGDSCALLFLYVPGQITMRLQLVLSAVYLGSETTALFVYAKQIMMASTQIIWFVLRVEFPGLIEKLAVPARQALGRILEAQKLSLYVAMALAVGATAVSVIAAAVPDFGLHRAATIIAAFAPTMLTMSLSLMVTQALAALGAYAAIARAIAISSAAGMLVSCMLVSTLGVYAFVLGEATFNLASFYIAYQYLQRMSSSSMGS